MKTSEREGYKEIISAIQRAGGRVTTVRLRILDVLNTAKKPLSVQDIARASSIDEVSVYRTISYFKDMAFIEEVITPDGVKRFAVTEEHHHHIMCKTCGHIEHVPCTEKVFLKPVSHPKFTSVDTHELTYYGCCTKCHITIY